MMTKRLMRRKCLNWNKSLTFKFKLMINPSNLITLLSHSRISQINSSSQVLTQMIHSVCRAYWAGYLEELELELVANLAFRSFTK